MSQDERTTPPPPEMVEFMGEIKGAIEKLVGEDGKVAMFGDSSNGVFCVLISISSLPSRLILTDCLAILANMVHKQDADEFNSKVMAEPKSVM